MTAIMVPWGCQVPAEAPMVAKIHAPLPTEFLGWVMGPEFGLGNARTCAIIGVSAYPGEQLTFWIRGGPGGWLYSYVPAHYLALMCGGIADGRPDFFTGAECKKVLCPADHRGFVVDVPIQSEVKIAGKEYRALATVDFLNSNEVLWVLTRAADGAILVSSHRYFDAELPEGGLRKMRATWK